MKTTHIATVIAVCTILGFSNSAMASPTGAASKQPLRKITNLLVKTVGFTSALVVGVPINIARKTAMSISDSASMIAYWGPSPDVAAILPGATACAVVACAKGFVDGCDNAATKKPFSLESFSLHDEK